MATVETRAQGGATTATGGSARSRLDDMGERAWKPRPVVAFAIVCASFAVPVFSALVAVQVAARIMRRPSGALAVVAWLGALVVLAAATSWVVDHWSRRALPLAAMLRLSLVFPDRAPSRFTVALKAGSGKALERALDNKATDAKFSTSEHAATLVVGLIGDVRAHDRLTRGHSERVRAYSDLIADELGLDADSRNKLHWAALLHDVGKLDVPAAILNKTDKLTNDEWQIIRGHPGASTKWLEPLRPWLGDWALAASEHHERYDGDGYPLRRRGEEISLAGRIVSVADAFDVMTAARSYKKPFPAAQARVELANNAGTQFDPKVVRAFLSISLGRLRLVMGPLAWLSGLSGMFSVGSVASGAAAAVTATVVAATAFAAPAAATAASNNTRSIAAIAAHRANGETVSIGAHSTTSAPADARSGGTTSSRGAGTAARGTSAGGNTTGTGPSSATPVGPPVTDPKTGDPITPTTSGRAGGSDGDANGNPTPGSSNGSGSGSGGGTGTDGGNTTDTTPGATTPVTVAPPADPTPTSAPSGTTPTTAPSGTTTPTTTPAAVQHAPVAHNDATGTLLTANVTIDVLANDTDADGNLDPTTLQVVTLPPSGYKSITVANGKINVKVNTLYTGTLVFTYRVCDTTNLCSQATVTAKFAVSLL
jgi:hypothetical protein